MLKRFVVGLLSLTMVITLAGCNTDKPVKKEVNEKQILIASTIGPVDAGIIAELENQFYKKTGIVVRHISAGTGATLKMAEKGQFDLVIVHAKDLEEKFVKDGFGTKRFDLMYNDFVIVGPKNDPAQIKGEKSVAAALKKIADSKTLFISRGDKSGTHMKELELWNVAQIKPNGDWYRVYDKGNEGNGSTLKYTDKEQAYTIMDRATYITLKKDLKIEVLMDKDEAMLNYITMIPINPEKFNSVKKAETTKFVEWLSSEEAQKIIRDFGKDKFGEPLFFPNSEVGKKLK